MDGSVALRGQVSARALLELRREALDPAVHGPVVDLGPSVGSYGWSGYYGSVWSNDPAEDMTTICIMQRAHAGDQRLPMWLDFWTAVYPAIDD